MLSRQIDASFYRAYYADAKDMSDDEVLAYFRTPESRMRVANHTEFLEDGRKHGLVPADFDPTHYIYANPDLLDLRPDWQATLHFVNHGRSEGRSYTRPFDIRFYAELYFDNPVGRMPLLLHWAKGTSSGYGSLGEALARNGFTSDAWVKFFDPAFYAGNAMLPSAFGNPTKLLVHFIESGCQALLPIAAGLEFDPEFLTQFVAGTPGVDPVSVYRIWLQDGLAAGAPASEKAFLRQIDVNLPSVPSGFDWRRYAAERQLPSDLGANKWLAFQHFVDSGIHQEMPIPLASGSEGSVLFELGNRYARKGDLVQAEQIYDRLALSPVVSECWLQHMGDLALRQRQMARALLYYRRTYDAGLHTYWTCVNAAEASLACGMVMEGLSWTSRGRAFRGRDRRLDHLQDRCVAQLYQLETRRYGEALSRSSPEAANDLRICLDTIYGHFVSRYQFDSQQEMPRPSIPGRRPLQVIMLANMDLPQCTFYRVNQKLEQLSDGDLQLQIFSRDQYVDFKAAAGTADAAILYRIAANPDVLDCIAYCRSTGVPLAYEIDDLVFDEAHFPEPIEAYGGTITQETHLQLRMGCPLFEHVIRLCDFGIASTDRLGEHLARLVRSKHSIIHRNGLSQELTDVAVSNVERPNAGRSGRVVVFYGSGTKAHARDFHDQVEPALIKLMAVIPEVEFIACGYVDATLLMERFPDRVRQHELIADRDEYLLILGTADINISVLGDNEFNHCKSEIKFLEAAAFGIPTVASAVAGLQEVPKPGKHILLCEPTAQSWFSALRRLVQSSSLRRQIGQAARQTALECYAPRVLGGSFVKAFRTSIGRPASSIANSSSTPDHRYRVLVVNVFYPPQTLGGATRVMADQVSIMHDKYSDRFEVAVLCGEDQELQPYKLEVYQHHGVKVYSISTPFREHMDWFPTDAEMEPLVDRVLDAFRPDIVHIHCIQRLTSTVVDRIAARHIPYIVTIHDAWWISDHQFLIDGLNQLRMPWETELYESAANPHSQVASLGRRQQLAGCLMRAAIVTVVSRTFAQIYEDAGIAGVRPVPNGLPILPPIEAAPPTEGRVRLGHVGGAAFHKGYNYLRRTLSQGDFQNLDLLLVDHSMEYGLERAEQWGNTRVRVIGHVPHDRVGWLYGQFDVLVAPSFWPESFGLVTREASAYQRWVVVSNLGAAAEDVVAGRNGFVIDVSQSDALAKILMRIDRDPSRFIVPPARVKLRQTEEQVAEIISVFEEILQTNQDPQTPRSASRKGAKVVHPRVTPRRLVANNAPAP